MTFFARNSSVNIPNKEYWVNTPVFRKCPLCDHDRTDVISVKMQHDLSLTSVICRNCSFVYANPMPYRELYDRFYAEAYADYYGHLTVRPQTQHQEKPPIYLQRRLRQINSIHPLKQSRLLEIGPGQGAFLWWARQQGASVIGIEPSTTFYQILVQDGLPCVNGSLEQDYMDIGGNYDIIAMFHVLEHFYDPNIALRHCRDLLAPKGILVIEVPNILKPYRSLDHYFLRYVHPSNFSPQTLQLMLEKHGFQVEMVDDKGFKWHTPQNLFVIARKLDKPPESTSIPQQSASAVLRYLQRYRKSWYLYLGPIWHLHQQYLLIKRHFLRLARRLKRFIVRV